MLKRVPAWKVPMVTTTGSSGSIRLLSMLCRAITICEPMTMGSIPRCGSAPWLCFPVIEIEKVSDEAIWGPGAKLTWPTSSVGMAWRANIASGS